jgi:threonine 3-dehydrogenase
VTQTYLITGGAGNLACQLTFALRRTGNVVLFDRAEQPVAATAPGCQYVRGDLTRPEELRRLLAEHRPDWVLHLASLLSASCEQDRVLGWQVNADGFFHLLEAMVATGVKRVFFPSSLAAYGGSLPDPLPEDYPEWPTGLYGATKVAGERLGACYCSRFGLDFRCIRLPVILSPHAPVGAASAYASRAFVEGVRSRQFVFRVRPETRVSVLYVEDALAAILRLIDARAGQLTRAVYNIHGLAPTAQQIAAAIRQRLPDADLRFDPDPAIVALVESWPAGIVDDSARKDWNWQPAYDLPGLADHFIRELQQ